MPSALVFVVDDEPVIAETLALVLRQHGYEAIAFTNPLRALSSAALKPDLLLSDFLMPQMDGLSLAEKLLAQCPTCKVLMISGAICHANNHPARDKFEFIEKPCSPPNLLAKIKVTLDSAAAC